LKKLPQIYIFNIFGHYKPNKPKLGGLLSYSL
jgi:hypothetical protein